MNKLLELLNKWWKVVGLIISLIFAAGVAYSRISLIDSLQVKSADCNNFQVAQNQINISQKEINHDLKDQYKTIDGKLNRLLLRR